MRLDRDFRTGGAMSLWLAEAMPLDDAQRRMIETNTRLAAARLRAACESGQLRFDLDPGAFLDAGDAPSAAVTCDGE